MPGVGAGGYVLETRAIGTVGLRATLTFPRFSHKDWYKNPSGVASTSVLRGRLDALTIDPDSGEGQVHAAAISFSETFGGDGDNPSPFLGDLVDKQFFDPNNVVKDGLLMVFDTTDLLNGSNNFTTSYESFSVGKQATLTTSGAAVPEPTTLALFTLAGLTLLSRRMN